MREHQIVITLKPEQFLEVQRLAKAAGAKSMGMFVRQKLLAALGIEGSAPTNAPIEAPADLTRLLGELKRIHGELKSFVAESLAEVYIEEEEEPSSIMEEEQEDEEPSAGIDRSSAVNNVSPLDNRSLSQVSFTADISSSGAAERLFFKDADFSFLAEDKAGAVADSLSSGNLSLEDAIGAFEQAQDDLESLAKKAFAISPRLGVGESTDNSQSGKEETRTVKSDPLSELLELPADALESAGNSSSDDEDDDDDVEDIDEDATFDVKLSLPKKRKVDPSVLPNEEPVPPKPDKASGPPPPAPKPLDPSNFPLSGGPPPRRRQ